MGRFGVLQKLVGQQFIALLRLSIVFLVGLVIYDLFYTSRSKPLEEAAEPELCHSIQCGGFKSPIF